MTAPAPEARQRYIGPMVLLTWTQTMISWAVFAPPVVANQALPDIGLDPIWIGVQPTIVFLAAMVASGLASSWVARINPMRATQLFVALCVFGPLLVATGSPLAMIVGSALIGAALGPATPASAHILARITPVKKQPLVFSIRQTGVTLGGVLAGFVTPIFTELWGWQAAIISIALACALTLIVVELRARSYAVHADPTVDRRVKILAPMRLVWSIPALRWLLLAILPLLIAQYGLTTFLVLYLQEDINLSVIDAGWVLAAALTAGGVGRILFGAIAGRFLAPILVLSSLSVVAAVGALLIAALSPGWPLLAIYLVGILFGITAAGWNGVFVAENARLAPANAVSQAVGGSSFIIFGAIVIGPAGLALLIDLTNFATAYIAIAALLGISLFGFVKSRGISQSQVD